MKILSKQKRPCSAPPPLGMSCLMKAFLGGCLSSSDKSDQPPIISANTQPVKPITIKPLPFFSMADTANKRAIKPTRRLLTIASMQSSKRPQKTTKLQPKGTKESQTEYKPYCVTQFPSSSFGNPYQYSPTNSSFRRINRLPHSPKPLHLGHFKTQESPNLQTITVSLNSMLKYRKGQSVSKWPDLADQLFQTRADESKNKQSRSNSQYSRRENSIPTYSSEQQSNSSPFETDNAPTYNETSFRPAEGCNLCNIQIPVIDEWKITEEDLKCIEGSGSCSGSQRSEDDARSWGRAVCSNYAAQAVQQFSASENWRDITTAQFQKLNQQKQRAGKRLGDYAHTIVSNEFESTEKHSCLIEESVILYRGGDTNQVSAAVGLKETGRLSLGRTENFNPSFEPLRSLTAAKRQSHGGRSHTGVELGSESDFLRQITMS